MALENPKCSRSGLFSLSLDHTVHVLAFTTYILVVYSRFRWLRLWTHDHRPDSGPRLGFVARTSHFQMQSTSF